MLRELVAQMPNENYIFFGDSKNAPYGTKTLEEVQKLTCADAEYLLSRGVKALVVACNTATSAAIRILREKYADMTVFPAEEGDKIKTEDIDFLVEDSYIKPFEGDKKLYVLAGAENMTPAVSGAGGVCGAGRAGGRRTRSVSCKSV